MNVVNRTNRLASVVLIASLASLSARAMVFDDSVAPDYDDTIVSSSKEAAMRNRANAIFDSAQICEDYQFAMYMLALVQPPQGRRGNNYTQEEFSAELAKCPRTYSDLAQILNAKISATRDFHTTLRPLLLLGTANPVIRSCGEGCETFVGSALLPLQSDNRKKLYAFAQTAAGERRAFEFLEINGKSADALFQEVVAQKTLSVTFSGNSGKTVVPILSRKLFDGRDRDDMHIVARDVTTGARVFIDASFALDPLPTTVEQEAELLKLSQKFRRSTSYRCREVAPFSTEDLGICHTEDGRNVLWNFAFKGPFEFEKYETFLSTHPSKHPAILDLRSNGGGDPFFAANLACAMGGEITYRELARRQAIASFYPETITVSSGRVFSPIDYLTNSSGKVVPITDADNGDLAIASPGWHVDVANPEVGRRDRVSPFWSRIGASPAECHKFSTPAFRNTKWVVMTNGGEFSATENFLSFVEDDNFELIQVGDRSWGGTGAPAFIRLPNTGILMRLSQARAYDPIQGVFSIEARGIAPDQYVQIEIPENFENRIRADFAFRSPMFRSKDFDTFRPMILGFALKIAP